jgi:hypothetical protein
LNNQISETERKTQLTYNLACTKVRKILSGLDEKLMAAEDTLREVSQCYRLMFADFAEVFSDSNNSSGESHIHSDQRRDCAMAVCDNYTYDDDSVGDVRWEDEVVVGGKRNAEKDACDDEIFKKRNSSSFEFDLESESVMTFGGLFDKSYSLVCTK